LIILTRKEMKMNKFEFACVTDSRDLSLFWSAYFSQFDSHQRDEQEDLIKWFESGDGLLLMSTDLDDPNNWIAWAVFNTEKTALLGYYVHGTTIDRSAPVTDIELWQRDRSLAFLAERFGNEMILLGEVEHEFDERTYAGLGFLMSNTFYEPKLLHGEPGEEVGHAEKVHYALAAIRLASDAPITEEEIEALIPDLDEIYGSVEEEPELLHEHREEDEKAVAADLENPPRADGADTDNEQ
jgi:hypothetical protein